MRGLGLETSLYKKPTIIGEKKLLSFLANASNVFLLEPEYPRQYMPLGLAKISSYVKAHGGEVTYGRNIAMGDYDLVCIATCFTYYSVDVLKAIGDVGRLLPNVPIIVGGVYATLMSDHLGNSGYEVNVFKTYSKKLDLTPPDYTIDWRLPKDWGEYSYLFTTRGCSNSCAYCAVPTLEPGHWINPRWKDFIREDKKYIMLSDNNLTACSENHYRDVFEHLSKVGKKVLFNNGIDNKFVNNNNVRLIANLKYVSGGLRLAFDRIEEDGLFQRAILRLKEAGIPKGAFFIFVLFNFLDTPQEANYRLRECVRLNVWGYPQMYVPLRKTAKKDPYVGKYWTKNLTRAFRQYWLFAGNFKKKTFEEFVKDKNMIMTKKDWSAWRYKR